MVEVNSMYVESCREILMNQAAIIEAFSNLPDSRRKAGQRHSQSLCLALFTLAIAAGNRGVLAVGDWIDIYSSDLIELLGLDKETLPSYSTIRRVLMRLDPKTYSQCLARFFSICPLAEEIINDDGKLQTDQAVTIVRAYLRKRGLILEQEPHDSRPYEFRDLPEVVKTLASQGVGFALDVISKQKEAKLE